MSSHQLNKNPLSRFIILASIAVALYFGIKVYQEVRPKSYTEKQMDCLKLGSDLRATYCLKLLNNQ